MEKIHKIVRKTLLFVVAAFTGALLNTYAFPNFLSSIEYNFFGSPLVNLYVTEYRELQGKENLEGHNFVILSYKNERYAMFFRREDQEKTQFTAIMELPKSDFPGYAELIYPFIKNFSESKVRYGFSFNNDNSSKARAIKLGFSSEHKIAIDSLFYEKKKEEKSLPKCTGFGINYTCSFDVNNFEGIDKTSLVITTEKPGIKNLDCKFKKSRFRQDFEKCNEFDARIYFKEINSGEGSIFDKDGERIELPVFDFSEKPTFYEYIYSEKRWKVMDEKI